MHPQIVPAADVILVGGGHSHIDVVRRYGMLDLKPFRLTLVSDTPLSMANASGPASAWIRRTSRATNFCASSTIQRMGASAMPESAAFSRARRSERCSTRRSTS